jgi:aminopeptidase N
MHLPDRPVLLQHLHLEADLDPDKPEMTATATLTVLVVQDLVERVVFDCRDLDIDTVWGQGQSEPLKFSHDGLKLSIALPAPGHRSETISLSIRYRVVQPAMGLYFVGSTPAHPDRPAHIWSQNQDDDAPFWIPCIDDPGVKFTTSVGIRVPEGLTALSNGVLAAEPSVEAGTVTWRWHQTSPIPMYLFAVVVGPFVETVDPGEGTDVAWYCLPGLEDSAKRAFSKTRKMIEYFEQFLGVPYPYPRYAQVAVSEFVFGGMENTTLTVITERALPDERAYPEYTADGLVAHELAHQWFGDYVTCREWAHAWLNEGFATYLDILFREHDLGPAERDYQLLKLAQGYYAEAKRYQRPLVTRLYEAPLDIFDRHLYHKGAWVLHMLRARLGDSAFRRALRIYVTRFAHNQAETPDLRRALEDATGVRMTEFFDRWVHGTGHPTIRWRCRAEGSDLVVTAKTKSNWDLDILVRATLQSDDDVVHRTMRLREGRGEVVLAGVADAVCVSLDPDYNLLGHIVPELTVTRLGRLLSCTHISVVRRIDAATVLGKKRTVAADRLLVDCLGSDAFWGIRAEAARALGSSGTEVSVDALCSALGEERHPKVRRAVVEALAECRGSEAAAIAVSHVLRDGDESLFVESAAARAVGNLRSQNAKGLLQDALSRESFNDMIRVASLSGLGALADSDALGLLTEHTKAHHSTIVRAGAVRALGELGRNVPSVRIEIWRVLMGLVATPSQSVRFALVAAADRIDDGQSLGLLHSLAEFEHDGLLRRRARDTARAISRRRESRGESIDIRGRVDELTQRQRKTDARVERLASKNAD